MNIKEDRDWLKKAIANDKLNPLYKQTEGHYIEPILIFDNEWVLIRNDWDLVGKAIAEAFNVQLYGGKQTKENFKVDVGEEHHLLYQWSSGLIEQGKFWGTVLERVYNLEPTKQNIEKISKCLELLTTEINYPMIDLVKRLKKAGYKTIMLSNSTKEINDGNNQRCEQEGYNYFDLFDKAYFSFKTHIRKPSKESYENVLNDNGLKAEQCIFIDDKDINLRGANDCGIYAIKYKMPKSNESSYELVRSVENLEYKLKRLGLKF